MQDVEIGLALRALRLRARLTQAQAAARAGLSQATWSRIERGQLGQVTVDTLRAALGAVEARGEIYALLRGGALGRLRDERHARLVGASAHLLALTEWDPLVEVTYSVFGERGSIDALGLRRAQTAALVVEDKATFNSAEPTLRTMDAKTRLAAQIVFEREGWRPQHVSRLLILEATMTNRLRVAAHEELLDRAFPLRGDAARSWLRRPVGSVSALRRCAANAQPARTGPQRSAAARLSWATSSRGGFCQVP